MAQAWRELCRSVKTVKNLRKIARKLLKIADELEKTGDASLRDYCAVFEEGGGDTPSPPVEKESEEDGWFQSADALLENVITENRPGVDVTAAVIDNAPRAALIGKTSS